MLLYITQSSETSTINLKHSSEKIQHPKAQQMTCWDNGFESLTSYCKHLAVKPGYSRVFFSAPPLAAADHHPRQDSKGNHDDERCNDHIQHTPLCKQNPRDKHVLAPHTILVHLLGDYSWGRKVKAWPFAELEAGIPHWQHHQIPLGSLRSGVWTHWKVFILCWFIKLAFLWQESLCTDMTKESCDLHTQNGLNS